MGVDKKASSKVQSKPKMMSSQMSPKLHMSASHGAAAGSKQKLSVAQKFAQQHSFAQRYADRAPQQPPMESKKKVHRERDRSSESPKKNLHVEDQLSHHSSQGDHNEYFSQEDLEGLVDQIDEACSHTNGREALQITMDEGNDEEEKESDRYEQFLRPDPQSRTPRKDEEDEYVHTGLTETLFKF